MHMYDEATVDCRKAIELKPDFSKAYSRLGTVHFQAGRSLSLYISPHMLSVSLYWYYWHYFQAGRSLSLYISPQMLSVSL